jgi:hypothetical protein
MTGIPAQYTSRRNPGQKIRHARPNAAADLSSLATGNLKNKSVEGELALTFFGQRPAAGLGLDRADRPRYPDLSQNNGFKLPANCLLCQPLFCEAATARGVEQPRAGSP